MDPSGAPVEVDSGAGGQQCGWLALRDTNMRGLFAGWEFDGRVQTTVRQFDADLFAGFGRRVAQRIAPLVRDPLIRQLWPMVPQPGKARRSAGLLPGPGTAPVGRPMGTANA